MQVAKECQSFKASFMCHSKPSSNNYVILQNPPNGELVHRIYLGCPFKQGYKKMTHQKSRRDRGPDLLPPISCIPQAPTPFPLPSSIQPFNLSILVKIARISPLSILLKLQDILPFSLPPQFPQLGFHTLSFLAYSILRNEAKQNTLEREKKMFINLNTV